MAISPAPKATVSAPRTTASARREDGAPASTSSRRRVAIRPPPAAARRAPGLARGGQPGRRAVRARDDERSGGRCALRILARPHRQPARHSTGRGRRSARREPPAAHRARKARASPSRRRSPADSGRPPSPTSVSCPRGSASMKPSAPASAAACSTRASDAVASPSRMLSATLPRSRVGCCGTQATLRRQSSVRQPERSTPPALTRPAVGSSRRSRRAATVLLPAPLSPTSATVSPGASSRSSSSSTGAGRAG